MANNLPGLPQPQDDNRQTYYLATGHDGTSFNGVYADQDGNLQVRNLVFDTDTLSWVAWDGGGGTGPSGPVGILNSTDVRIDPATEGTLLGILAALGGSDFAERKTYTAGGLMEHLGSALPGAATSASAWKIKKYVYDASGNASGVLWADGNSNFDNVWDNVAILSYS